MNQMLKILLSLLLFISYVSASAPLVEGGESFKDVNDFIIGSGHSIPVASVAFSPDGKTIISGSKDNSIKLWSVEKQTLLHTFEVPSTIVTSVAFSPDGKTIISGSYDKSIKLWSVEKQRLLHTFEGHSYRVSSVAFSPDGKTIISGSKDNSIKLWSVEKQRVVDDVYSIGRHWAWFDKDTKIVKRVDDGTLLMRGDTPLLPSDNTAKDRLEISFPKEITLYSQKGATVEANVSNRGEGTSYWIACSSPSSSVLMQHNQIMKLKAHETQTLSMHLWSALASLNKHSVSKNIKFTFATANGDYLTKEVLVHFKTPKMEVEEAKYDSKNKSLLVKIHNSGEESIKDLDIKIGKETQKIDILEANATVSKAFVVASEPHEANISISKPFYEWKLHTKVTVEDMWVYYAVLAVLILALLIAILYYKRYRHPLVLRIQNANSSLEVIALDELAESKQRLESIGRFESVLKANSLSKEKFDAIVEFAQSSEGLTAKFIALTGLKMEGDDIVLPVDFELDIATIKIDSSGDRKALKKSTDKVLAITNNKKIQDSLADLAKDKTDLVIAPDYKQLTSLLLSDDIYHGLIALFRDNLSLKDISPYQISSDVKKENMFFGRTDIISNIMHTNLRNYIIVGARQLGKSSLLTALHRRYQERDMLSYYVVLDEESDLVFHLSKALDVDNDMKSVQEKIYNSKMPIVFLIDEVDKFLLLSKSSEKFTSIFRSLSQGGKAYFILAGFWELYKETLAPQSPLRNFGDIIKLEGLEEEACRELITQPMALLGIGYSSPKIVEDIIYQTGRRSNLVSVVCDRLISQIEGKEISPKDLEQVLDGGFVEYISLSDIKLDRVIEYATITMKSFYAEDLYEIFDKHDLKVDTITIEQSLQRLELSYVLYQKNGEYRYRVPLFVEKTIKSAKSMENLLKREIAELKKYL